MSALNKQGFTSRTIPNMKRNIALLPILSVAAVMLVVCFFSDTAVAASVSQSIQEPTNVNLWRFFRSLINWGLVAFLIFIAFANVTRLNIDTYSIKKTLPNAVIGFIGAQLSLPISVLVINLADSLSKTATDLALQATGVEVWDSLFGSDWTIGITALIGFVLAIGSFSVGVGILIGILIVLVVLAFPAIIMEILNLMFIIRGFVIQLLVAISPLAFIALATPFSAKYFSKWWGQFATWVFMKPIGFGLLSLGAIIVHAGVPNEGVAFIAGLAAMVAAITIPWRAGGWINAGVARIGKSLAGGARSGALGWATKTAEGGGRFAGVGAGLAGALSLPETVQLARKKKAEKAAEAGIRYAAGQLGEKNLQKGLENKRIAELSGDMKDLSTEELSKRFDDAKDPMVVAALMRTLAERSQLGRAYASMKNGPKDKDPEALKRWEVERLGGSIKKAVGKDGKEYEYIDGEFATRIGAQIDDLHKKNGVTQHGFRQMYDKNSGKTKLLGNKENEKIAAAMYQTDPYTIPRSLTEKGVIVDYKHTDGTTKKKLFGAVPKAIADGVIDEDTILNSRGFDKGGIKAIRENWGEGLELKLEEDFRESLADQLRDKRVEELKATNAQGALEDDDVYQERLKDIAEQDREAFRAEANKGLESSYDNIRRARANLNAFKARIQPDGSKAAALEEYRKAGIAVPGVKRAPQPTRAARPAREAAEPPSLEQGRVPEVGTQSRRISL